MERLVSRFGGRQIRLYLTLALMVLGAALAGIRPFGGLDSTGHIMLGALISALAAWVFQPAGGTLTIGAVIIILGGLLAGIPINDMTAGFTSPSLWLFIPAMLIGASMMRTGLGKRMVLALFKRMELTYARILVGWFAAGVLFALITPAISVRFVMLTPIAVSVADACLLEKGGRGRSLIVISCWAFCIFPSIAWQNGSLFGPAFTSFLPEGPMRDMATAEMWFIVMAPWLLFSVIFVVALYFLLKPETKLAITKTQIKGMYDELGPIGKKELGCLVTLVFMLVCLVLQTFLPLTANQALLASLVLLLILGVISGKDISTGINWDVIVFFGVLLGFSNIFSVSGLTAWFTPFLSDLIQAIAISPLVFVLALFAICVLCRFFDAAQGWITASIFSLATPMLYSDHGIHPLVPTMVFVSASNVFFFRYAQPWVVQAESVCGDGGWNPRHLREASILYVCLAAVLLVLSRFYWGAVGVM